MSSEWPLVRLGDLVTLKGGFAYKGEHLGSGEVKLLGMGVVSHSERFLKNGMRSYGGEFSESFRANSGDIVIATRQQSDNLPILGCPALVPSDLTDTDIVVGTNLYKVTNQSDVDNKFLYWLLRGNEYRNRILECSKGTTVRMITKDAVENFTFPCPPLPVRREISHFLDALDDRITLLRETNATLEAIARALFKSWFVDFDPVRAKMEGRTPEGMDEATAALFPDGFETSELGEVPRGWRWGTLSDLATFQNGYAFKSKDWTDSGHPVVKIGDVKPGIIDLEGCSYVAHETVVGLDRFRLSRGDLLVGMTGYVGATGLVPSVEPAAYLNQRVGRMATKSGVTDLGYLYCAARSPAFKEFAEAQSHGSAQANVSGASLMGFPAVLVPSTLMECFNSIVSGLLEGILVNHEKSQALAQIRDAALPQLISGNLRIEG